jgi:hypothetical protein
MFQLRLGRDISRAVEFIQSHLYTFQEATRDLVWMLQSFGKSC